MQHGSQLNPANPYLTVQVTPDLEPLEWDTEYLCEQSERPIQYFADSARSVVMENDSPDIAFRYSVNPYRGCAHACPYCYARNTHEYLGLNAGLDFETKIFVKQQAPQLLREFLSRKNWHPEPITFSGVTDCYQPAERHFRLTRQCLEVAAEFRVPVGIVCKNALVLRDLDLFQQMAPQGLIQVNLSVTTLDPELARVMEPRASIPQARLRAIRELTQAGIPVRVMVAPIIPGLNDSEIPQILQAAREAGAQAASTVLLRLPLTVEPVFREWLRRTQPTKAAKIIQQVRQTRGGKAYRSDWGERMSGTGLLAEQIQNVFHVFRQRYGYEELPPLDTSHFRPVRLANGQRLLF